MLESSNVPVRAREEHAADAETSTFSSVAEVGGIYTIKQVTMTVRWVDIVLIKSALIVWVGKECIDQEWGDKTCIDKMCINVVET